jgi:hypothetical protein
MNLEKELLSANTKARITKIAAFVLEKPEHFSQLMQLFLRGPYRVTQRAALPLSCCVEQNPALVKPYLRQLLRVASQKDAPVPLKRNIVRLLQFIDLPDSVQGKAVSVCFGFLGNPAESIAVKVFSMTVISNIAQRQPPLARELVHILEDQLPYASAGFRSRARKIMARHKL